MRLCDFKQPKKIMMVCDMYMENNALNRLVLNWGEKADAMACKAHVRLYDSLSSWECYIYAINPDDTDEAMVLFRDGTDSVSLRVLMQCYNGDGDPPQIDRSFVPRELKYLIKEIKKDG